jgi:hypothetical protein
MVVAMTDVRLTRILEADEFLDGYSIVEVAEVVKFHIHPGSIEGLESAANWLNHGDPMTPKHARKLAEALVVAANEAERLPQANGTGGDTRDA